MYVRHSHFGRVGALTGFVLGIVPDVFTFSLVSTVIHKVFSGLTSVTWVIEKALFSHRQLGAYVQTTGTVLRPAPRCFTMHFGI
jgi:cell shape-determining protein MreD